MSIAQIIQMAGGIGLFLLGMLLMTEGLRLAAGNSLRQILAASTSTLLRGILSGAFITALVQASGAVTVATVGFVNAGLMKLRQAIAIVYGANLGTTFTAWLVVAVGFSFDIDALALPLIAIGMVLRLLGGGRRGAMGEALAGFGLFFLGLNILQQTFGDLGSHIQLEAFAGNGIISLLIYVGIGFIMTFLMQSSSAAMAITITAVSGGIIGLNAAAAVAIGANLGTTSTALIAAIGATPAAKRVALAHLVFNLVTAVAAFGLLPLLIPLLERAMAWAQTGNDAAIALALFHSLFNLLGVLLVGPFTGPLSRLLKRFYQRAEASARPRYLDKTLSHTPGLALHAIFLELERLSRHVCDLAIGAVSAEEKRSADLERQQQDVDKLALAIARFVTRIQHRSILPDQEELLINSMRQVRSCQEIGELALQVLRLQPGTRMTAENDIASRIAHFRGECVHLLQDAIPASESDPEQLRQRAARQENQYQQLKIDMMRTGIKREVPVSQMVETLEELSALRTMCRKAAQNRQDFVALRQFMDEFTPVSESADPENGDRHGESEHRARPAEQ